MKELKQDTTAVKDAAIAFYRALQTILDGDASPMESVWSHAEDVTFLGPQGEILVGPDQVFSAWKEQANMRISGTIQPGSMHIVIGGDIAIIQNEETGSNNPKGEPDGIHIRATNIFRLEDGEWKMISHHTDLVPNFK